ncbi:SGNH/GDSL hydrolase family protein [Aeromonas sp. 3925]|uniref:SGNH/GDSL hydrolase family protein n=1 Tax=Aeromonas genomosp. paramedia TaxID=3086176 RepID=UPI001FFD4ABB|nr:SGNH/GDSL hydrolase family protein [Aeromonas genomosp. paramedia]MCK2084182.1 SGNH/GDSL hydrolase family protein [Aeromonas genomosp. paramedia]
MKTVKGLLLLAAVGLAAETQAARIEATDHRLNYEGRIVRDWVKQDVQFNWPATRLSFLFQGSDLAIAIDGQQSQFDLLIDGQLHGVIKTDQGMNTYPLLQLPQPRAVRVELVKRTETYDAMLTLDALITDGVVSGIWQQKPHLLFVGDSISAGMGSESDKRECSWEENLNSSNARLAFPAKTAALLGATHSQVSYSGLGLLRNWDGNQPHHALPHYLNKAGAVYQGGTDFESQHPALIVVELGTNDFSSELQPHEPWQDQEAFQQAWVDGYVDLLRDLRQRYDSPPIILMGQYLWPHDRLNQALARLQQQLALLGDPPVLVEQMRSDNSGCLWHPTAAEHDGIAASLAGLIRQQGLLPE